MIDTLRIALKGISAYRDLCRTELMSQVNSLLSAIFEGRGEEAAICYAEIFFQLRKEGHSGLGDWLHHQLRYSEAPYPLLVEKGGRDPALEQAARRDVETLALLAGLDCDKLIGAMKCLLPGEYQAMLSNLPRWRATVPFDFDCLTAAYQKDGAGVFAQYRAFVWENGALTPIPSPDIPMQEELVGYERQRQAVINNTKALLEGKQVNNVLLYGDAGAGKSATIKSLLAIDGFDQLRIIEVQKEWLCGIPALVRGLGSRRQKFILFLDDLAFDQDDRTYSVLKTVLEGGVEARPINVAVYATSNRRRLVRQTLTDRAGDEVDIFETIQEKTGLSERFGLRIPYLAMSQPAYLDLIERLVIREGMKLDREELRAQAVQWEARHPGRTPRTARQFLASLRT